jgi:hypothetical protein
MEIDPSSSKRRRDPEIKVEGEREKPTRNPEIWVQKKENLKRRFNFRIIKVMVLY